MKEQIKEFGRIVWVVICQIASWSGGIIDDHPRIAAAVAFAAGCALFWG